MTQALAAGRELDALVAEKVMGLVLCDHWSSAVGGAGIGVVFISNPDCGHEKCVPRIGLLSYSTDIAAAWEVVEHLTQKRHFRVEIAWGGDECPEWACDIHEDGYRPFQDQTWSAEATTAPLAICRAALAAVEASS